MIHYSPQVGLICIATRKYINFVPKFVSTALQFFHYQPRMTVYLFTDQPEKVEGDGRSLVVNRIPSYGFPEATLKRFHVFDDYRYLLRSNDYLAYCDVDSEFVNHVQLHDVFNHHADVQMNVDSSDADWISCVWHPGFWNKPGCGSWESRKESTSYVEHNNTLKYVAGGFFASSTTSFLTMSAVCKALIDEDLRRGITPVWHDESAINKYIQGKKIRLLDPEYVYPEEKPEWFKWPGTPKILALKKIHSEVRS